jgi:hypothetical protein
MVAGPFAALPNDLGYPDSTKQRGVPQFQKKEIAQLGKKKARTKTMLKAVPPQPKALNR